MGAGEDTENREQRRIHFFLLQIRADDLNDVVSGLGGRLGFSRHVIADVVFHQLGHEAVDGAASGSEALRRFGAVSCFEGNLL